MKKLAGNQHYHNNRKITELINLCLNCMTNNTSSQFHFGISYVSVKFGNYFLTEGKNILRSQFKSKDLQKIFFSFENNTVYSLNNLNNCRVLTGI